MGTWIPPITQQEAELLAMSNKDDVEYWRTHDFKTKQDDRAREFAAGMSTIGSVLLYTGPLGAVAGLAMQVPDIYFDAGDTFRAGALHGWSPELTDSILHLILDIPAVSLFQRIPGSGKILTSIKNALAKHNADEVLNGIADFDDLCSSFGIDIVEKTRKALTLLGKGAFAPSKMTPKKRDTTSTPSSTYVVKPQIIKPIKRRANGGRLFINNQLITIENIDKYYKIDFPVKPNKKL